ncbi:MAG: protein kinase [Planctomycetes bacterium]|nr:protein kinase [Planctomycetota bacterium]
MSELQHGDRINNYIVEELIGTGSFGQVFKAKHHVFDEYVAIKIPTDPQYVQNLRREGVTVHGLRHDNIVRALDMDPFATPPYLIMEYLAGPTLREVIDQHRELNVTTLRYHLDQADATARAGCWHAAVNEARSFVEGLIVGIAEFESARRRDLLSGLSPSPESRSGFQECRKYLVTVGFADVDEMDLFKQVYAVASRKGSHPGVTDEAWGRLVCHLVWMAGYFLLNRYAMWKSHRRRWPTEPDGSVAARGWRPLGSCLRWLGGVARRVVNQRRLAASRILIHGRTDSELASSSIETAE